MGCCCYWFVRILPCRQESHVSSPGLRWQRSGQIWRIYAAGVIYKNRKLASTGAYSLVRHPLYLGNFLILVGFTIAGGNWIVMAVVAFFFLFYYPTAIRYEDQKLEGIFGDEWRAWSKNIPGMFPTSLNWQANEDAVGTCASP